MPKLTRVTADDLAKLSDQMDELRDTIDDVYRRNEAGYCDQAADPLQVMSDAMGLSRAAQDFVFAMLVQHKMILERERVGRMVREDVKSSK